MDCEYINEEEEVTISQHASICSRAAHYLQYDRHLFFMYVVICTLKWAVNHFIAARQRYINCRTINNRKGKKFVNATWQDKAYRKCNTNMFVYYALIRLGLHVQFK